MIHNTTGYEKELMKIRPSLQSDIYEARSPWFEGKITGKLETGDPEDHHFDAVQIDLSRFKKISIKDILYGDPDKICVVVNAPTTEQKVDQVVHVHEHNSKGWVFFVLGMAFAMLMNYAIH